MNWSYTETRFRVMMHMLKWRRHYGYWASVKDNSKYNKDMSRSCNVIRALPLSRFDHHKIDSYKYKWSYNLETTFDSTHKQMLFAESSHILAINTNFFTNPSVSQYYVWLKSMGNKLSLYSVWLNITGVVESIGLGVLYVWLNNTTILVIYPSLR